VASAGSQLAGPGCSRIGRHHHHPGRSGCPTDGRTIGCGAAIRHLSFAHGVAGVCAANDAANVGGFGRILDVHLHLLDAGSQESPRRDGADSPPRCPAIRAGARLSVLHGGLLRRTLSRQCAWGGACRHLRDLYQPGVEHGLQLFSGAEDHPTRVGGGESQLPFFRLATVLGARGAVCHAGPGLEHDDVDVRWLVLRGGVGGHFGR